MVELLALLVAESSHRLWRFTLGRVLAISLWLAYGVTVPRTLTWAEEVLPEAVNLALPFAGVLVATVQGVRHWQHHQHHAHDPPPIRPPPQPPPIPPPEGAAP